MVELGLPGLLRRLGSLHRRMAGARARPAGGTGSPRAAEFCGGRPARSAGIAHACRASVALLFAVAGVTEAHAQILSSRIWPARDYTRLTIESKEELRYSLFSVKDPERLVLDLEIPDISAALAELNGKVASDDPQIQ